MIANAAEPLTINVGASVVGLAVGVRVVGVAVGRGDPVGADD